MPDWLHDAYAWLKSHPHIPITWAVVETIGLFILAVFADLPGDIGNDYGLFWLTFWATLLAGILIAVPVGVVISISLSNWQRRLDRDQRTEEARREVSVAKQTIRRLIQNETNIGFTAEQPYAVPDSVERIKDYLATQPYTHWGYWLGEEAGSFLAAIETLGEVAHDYRTNTTEAVQRLRGLYRDTTWLAVRLRYPVRHPKLSDVTESCIGRLVWGNATIIDVPPRYQIAIDLFYAELLRRLNVTEQENSLKSGVAAVEDALAAMRREVEPTAHQTHTESASDTGMNEPSGKRIPSTSSPS